MLGAGGGQDLIESLGSPTGDGERLDVREGLHRGAVARFAPAVDLALQLDDVHGNDIERIGLLAGHGQRQPEALFAPVHDGDSPRLVDLAVVQEHLDEQRREPSITAHSVSAQVRRRSRSSSPTPPASASRRWYPAATAG